MKLPNGLTIETIMESIEGDEQVGFCLSCGESQCAEPDARNYECEGCGARQVFGAEEILQMLV